MIKVICFFLLLNFSLQAFAQNEIKAYYISFNCCFTKDSVKIYNNFNKLIYKNELNTNASSGICDNAFLLLPYSRKTKSINLVFNEKVIVKVKLRRANKLMYIAVYKSAGIFDYEISDKIKLTQ